MGYASARLATISSGRIGALAAGFSSALMFAVMGLCVRASSVPAEQSAAMRGLLGVVLLFPYAAHSFGKLSRKATLWLISRSIFGALGILCLFLNFQNAGVSTAIALANLSPLFVLALSGVFERERLARHEYLAVSLMIGGALVLQSPFGVELGSNSLSIGIAGALFAALAFLSLKRAARQVDNATIVWSFSTAVFLVALAFSRFQLRFVTLEDALLTGTAATTGLIGQLLLTRAFASLPAAVASAISLTSLLWGIALELLVFGTLPSSGTGLGYGLILVGALAINGRPRPR